MGKEHLQFTSNGYDFLESYTKQLYGERGSFEHNLRRYVTGDEFLNACRMPKTVEEIPEISLENILEQIKREEHFSSLCRNVVDLFSEKQQKGELTTDDCYEIAGIMGLCPGQCDWHETLFPHLVDLYISSKEEGAAILESINRQPDIVQVMVSVMSDGLRERQIINYNGRNMLSQGYARNYFRGENAYYSQSLPSMFRNLPKDPNQFKLYKFIAEIRMMEFVLWLNTLSFVKQWPYGDIFHGAVAQHYGIPTNGIDMTSDLKTAIFFASCCYENGKWRPLREEEYKTKDARESVAKYSGDSRYGVIFTMPADISNMSLAAKIPELHLAGVTPIGFQPFMRCSNQFAYMIEAGYPYDLYLDPSFKKVKFKLCPEICEWIFEEMDKGKKIYPQETCVKLEDIVERIKKSNQFSENAFLCALRCQALEHEADSIREALKKENIEIVSNITLCSDQEKEEMGNSFWNNEAKRWQGVPVYHRIRFSI